MRVSAKADYGVRAMVELAAAGSSSEQPAKGELLAVAQAIPTRFLENILGELRVHGLVQSRRGADGGYWLAKAADEIDYPGPSAPLREVWLALRVNIRQVLETVTLADVVAGVLPEPISRLAEHPEAAEQRETRFGAGRESA